MDLRNVIGLKAGCRIEAGDAVYVRNGVAWPINPIAAFLNTGAATEPQTEPELDTELECWSQDTVMDDDV